MTIGELKEACDQAEEEARLDAVALAESDMEEFVDEARIYIKGRRIYVSHVRHVLSALED